MQGIYTYIHDTNYVPREYGVAAILLFLFMVLISLLAVLNLLYFYISTFRSICAVPNMAVFCSSLTSWFPDMLFTYFLNVFEIVPVAPIITGITFVFTLLLFFFFSGKEMKSILVCRDAYILRRAITVLKQILYFLTQITNLGLVYRRGRKIANSDY